MEGGIEDRHVRRPREAPARRLDAEEIGGIVQGGEGDQLADGGDHVVIDQGRCREEVAAVHHPMADDRHLRLLADDTVLGIDLENEVEPRLMIRHRPTVLFLADAAVRFRPILAQAALRGANPLQQRVGDRCELGDGEHFHLDR